MSKASEWSVRMRAAQKEAQRILYEPRPCPYLFLYQATLHSRVASVTDMGDLEVCESVEGIRTKIEFPGDEALQLARWILDTFGETP